MDLAWSNLCSSVDLVIYIGVEMSYQGHVKR